MAKELPYFQFEPAEYLTKNISFCSIAAQGLFINICSYYWQRNCELTKDQVLRRLNYPEELQELIDENIIHIEDDNIIIKFLDNQRFNAIEKSKIAAINGSKGGKAKAKTKQNVSKSVANTKQNLSENVAIRKDKIIKDDIIKQFESFRTLYKGRKRGLETEFENFKKKHKDWKEVLPLLSEALEKQILWRNQQKKKGEFVPEWAMLTTWINQRRWEEEVDAEEKTMRKAGDPIPVSAKVNLRV